MSDLQRRDQKSCSALIGYASPLLHMTPCDVVDVKVEPLIISLNSHTNCQVKHEVKYCSSFLQWQWKVLIYGGDNE